VSNILYAGHCVHPDYGAKPHHINIVCSHIGTFEVLVYSSPLDWWGVVVAHYQVVSSTPASGRVKKAEGGVRGLPTTEWAHEAHSVGLVPITHK
jgi:hypothetical protein